ncbi:MAG: hypothetical protein HRU12_19220, partial [Phaeodactylibacter sp.]|nr:hypothetical protein [Phaeodactylibacter sp.]
TNPSIVLNGAGSTTGPNIEYTWSGSPQAPAQIDSFNATITLPGTYQLIVTDTLNFCADTVAAVVVVDTLQPFADAGPDRILTCDSTAVTLDGMNSSTGVQFDYDWIEIFGTGLVDTNSLQATVNSPGAYMLLVTNIQNGCFDTSFAIVNIDTLSPTASLATPLRLNCTVTEVDLDGTSSDNGPGFSFNWSTSGTGNFIEGTSTLTPTVNAGGFYQLEIRNDSTGCTDTAVIEVIQDTLPPLASAGPPALLNCNSPTVFLGSDDTSTGADILFNWSGPPGGISGSANDAFVEVTLPGTYVLLVRNSTTGCEASDSTTVTANLSFPTASAGPDTELDCNAPEVILDGSGSTTENTAIIWSGPCIIGDPSSLIVTANCDGLYVLSVTDTINGCTALDSVLVTRDPLDPNAILPDSIELSCETGTAIIDASASEGTSFSWLFDGNPISQTGLSFTADSAGIYTLIANNATGNCPDTASVVTTLDCSPNLSIAPPDTLTCSVQAITLDATGSDNGPNITYEWLAPNAGCIESGSTTLQPVVRCPGTYQLIATNSTFGLSDTLSVVVPSNTLAPIAEAGPGDTLTCEEPTTILSAAGSTTGPGIGYTWTKLDDETFEKDSFSIFVNDASTYFLTVIDSTNGCFAEDIVVVQISDNLPDLNFSSTIIPCMQDSFWLQAFVVPQGPQYEYSWSGDIILDGADSISVLLDTAGMVRLTVTNPANNCSSFRDVLVTQQECVPCLDSIAADTLTCDIMQVSLNGSYCEPCTGCTVSWTTNGGNIVSNTDSLSITVDQPGFYTLTATDTLGFSTEITVPVIEQVALPEISTTSDQILSCQDTVVTLEVFVSGNNADLSYQWATTDGVLPSLDSLSAISVVHPGVYSITVRDQYTGCESTDTVNVTADTIPPIANAGPEQILTCDVTTVALDGSSSSFGSSILYEWSGPLTNIPGNNTFNPSVNIQGWYELLVTDTLTGCTALDSVFVAQNTDNPNIVPIPDTTISCTIPSVVLSGNLPDTTGFSTCWFLTDGNGDPTGPCNASLDFEVNSSGQYAFEVKNDTTGCTSSVVVNVTQDTLLPVLEVADTFFFPCKADSLNISAIATPAGALNYTWSSPDGFPITGADQETATVFQPGAYLVQVERTDNGCAQSQLIEVVDDPRIPEVIAG